MTSGNTLGSQAPRANTNAPALTVSPDESVTVWSFPPARAPGAALPSSTLPPFFLNDVTTARFASRGDSTPPHG